MQYTTAAVIFGALLGILLFLHYAHLQSAVGPKCRKGAPPQRPGTLSECPLSSGTNHAQSTSLTNFWRPQGHLSFISLARRSIRLTTVGGKAVRLQWRVPTV
jgi:hypothetical protein